MHERSLSTGVSLGVSEQRNRRTEIAVANLYRSDFFLQSTPSWLSKVYFLVRAMTEMAVILSFCEGTPISFSQSLHGTYTP